MDDRSRRLPSGASPLADRIAALQRKASDTSGRSESPTNGIRSSSYSYSSSPSAHIGSPPSSTSKNNAQAVRDRIARFQQSADQAGEQPLVPRSSFGAPAPNPDSVKGRTYRAYPGATSNGGGSGNWGEGVLRPQMTGGVQPGGSSGGGGGGTGRALMPQMTGPTWSRRNVSSPQSSFPPASSPQRTISGRNLFEDMQNDSDAATDPHEGQGGLGSHAEAVATQAAALKGMALSPPRLSRNSSRKSASEGSPGILPQMPDTPTVELEPMSGESATDKCTVDSELISDLPSPPVEEPRTATETPSESFDPDTSVEIGVRGATSEQVDLLRARAERLDQAEERQKKVLSTEELESPPTPPAKDWESGMPKSSSSGQDLIFRIGDVGAVTQEKETVDSTAPCVQTPSLLIVSDETRDDKALPSRNGTASRGINTLDPEKMKTRSARRSRSRSTTPESVNPPPRTSSLYGSESFTGSSSPLSTPAISASGSTFPSSSPLASPSKPEEAESAPDATSPLPLLKEEARRPNGASRTPSASASARATSIRRPRPGQMLSVADLDASDDEYEPGWASVISTSRPSEEGQGRGKTS